MGTDTGMIFYTGIGARETPAPVLALIEKIAAHLAGKGCILRSGGAEGAGAAFEKGCVAAGGKKEIFLPWRGFKGNNSQLYNIPHSALLIAQGFNPTWNSLSDSDKKLKARYAQTLLGTELKRPSEFVICYTPGGKVKGGTGMVLQMAAKYSIHVFNIGQYEVNLPAIGGELDAFFQKLSLPLGGIAL